MANKDNVLFPEYRNEFNVWLHDRLQSLELDEEILGEYITGILYGDDSTLDEKREAVEQTMVMLPMYFYIIHNYKVENRIRFVICSQIFGTEICSCYCD